MEQAFHPIPHSLYSEEVQEGPTTEGVELLVIIAEEGEDLGIRVKELRATIPVGKIPVRQPGVSLQVPSATTVARIATGRGIVISERQMRQREGVQLTRENLDFLRTAPNRKPEMAGLFTLEQVSISVLIAHNSPLIVVLVGSS